MKVNNRFVVAFDEAGQQRPSAVMVIASSYRDACREVRAEHPGKTQYRVYALVDIHPRVFNTKGEYAGTTH